MSPRPPRIAAILLAAVLISVLAAPVSLFSASAKGGKGVGKGARSEVTAIVAVPDTTYGSTVVATATSGSEDRYVFVQCYTPNLGGDYVYAAYFQVVDGQATVGPLWSTLWPRSDAECTAELGYATRDGWGKWSAFTSSTFHVAAGS